MATGTERLLCVGKSITKFTERRYNFYVGIDIDNVYKYKHKGL